MSVSISVNQADLNTSNTKATLNDYLTLCKPRVVLLMILTSMVGMCLARPVDFSWMLFWLDNLGIALVASSAACVNHLVDRHIDRLMRRTKNRPIVQGKVNAKGAVVFASILFILGMAILFEFANTLTAVLTFCSLVGYAGIYTLYLKHATPQNIVIGGLAGAAPPLLGWVAMTGHVDAGAIALLLIIFVWTPPHFWALAIHRVDDYANADVPMLPVTHGIPFTKLNIVLYSILLCMVSLLPFLIGMSGWIYLSVAIVLGARFLQLAIRLKRASDDSAIALQLFRYSISYLTILFIALVVDRFF